VEGERSKWVRRTSGRSKWAVCIRSGRSDIRRAGGWPFEVGLGAFEVGGHAFEVGGHVFSKSHSKWAKRAFKVR
jgi:hypothetical protein